MNKGVVSVGKRKGNNPTKVVGIRPDKNQHLGTQQLEFSLIGIEVDGVSKSFNVETDLEIKLNAGDVQQLVQINPSSSIFNNCKVEFDIHSTGLELLNQKYSSTTTIRDYGFNITNEGQYSGSNISNFAYANNGDLGKTTSYMDCYVGQIVDDYIVKGDKTDEEEFGDADLSNYVVDNTQSMLGSAVYLKNALSVYIKTYNIDNYLYIILNNLCHIYGLELLDDAGPGKYLVKNDKKVIGYSDAGDGKVILYVNTMDIPDSIKSLFIRKTFNDTSYLDITISDFITQITNKFNKNLTIDVDTTYYKPINDVFKFKVSEKSINIDLPIAYNSEYDDLQYLTTHTLKDNADGSYRYTKLLQVPQALDVNNAKYFDATINVNSAAWPSDNLPIYYRSFWTSFASGEPNGKSQEFLQTQHRRVSGSNQAGSAAYPFFVASGSNSNQWPTTNHFPSSNPDKDWGIPMAGDRGYFVSSQFATSRFWMIPQTHFLFDSSGVSGTVSNLELKIRAGRSFQSCDSSSVDIIAVKSTLGHNLDHVSSKLLYNDFAGFNDGVDTDLTASITYSGVNQFIDGPAVGPSAQYYVSTASYAWTSMSLNSVAETDLDASSSFSLAIVDYWQFWRNVCDTHYGTTGFGHREFVGNKFNTQTAAWRPYIEYDVAGAASGYGNDVNGVVTGNIGKIIGVATANVGKVSGT